MPPKIEDLLSPDDMLQSEFDYIAQTAFQANEDRARVTTFYLVNLGGFVAALYSTQLTAAAPVGSPPVLGVNALFAGLFFVLSLTGLLTLLQLVRLRQAWYESITAMNQIKEYYRERFPGLGLGGAMRWNKASVPALHKRWSISYLLMLQVAVMGSASLGAAVVYLGLLFQRSWWPVGLAAGVLFLAGQMALYWRLLRNR